MESKDYKVLETKIVGQVAIVIVISLRKSCTLCTLYNKDSCIIYNRYVRVPKGYYTVIWHNKETDLIVNWSWRTKSKNKAIARFKEMIEACQTIKFEVK